MKAITINAAYELFDENLKGSLEKGKITAKEEDEIVNKYVELKTLQRQSVKMTANQEKEQYLILKNKGTINGFAGCN